MTINIDGKEIHFENACNRTWRYVSESKRVMILLLTNAQYSNDDPEYWFVIRVDGKEVKESKAYSTQEQSIRWMKISAKKYIGM